MRCPACGIFYKTAALVLFQKSVSWKKQAVGLFSIKRVKWWSQMQGVILIGSWFKKKTSLKKYLLDNREIWVFSPVRQFGELFSRCDSSVVMKENIIFLELQGKGVKCCLVSTWVKPKGQNINSAFYFSVCWNFLMRSWENVSVSQLLPMLPT